MPGTSSTVQQDLDLVKAELRAEHFRDVEIGRTLAGLKLVARTPSNAPEVYSKGGIELLAETAFGSESIERPISSLEAARVLANALLLQDRMQQVLADACPTESIVNFYSQNAADHEFVGARIVFLLTYKKTCYHSRQRSANPRTNERNGSDGDSEAGVQPDKQILWTDALHVQLVNSLMDVLSKVDIPEKPLDPPVVQILNALAIIDWPTSISQGHEGKMLVLGKQLIRILDLATSSLEATQLETMLIALVTVIRKLNATSYPKSSRLLQVSLLPQDEERDQPLGKSQTLASRLLRLQTSGGLTILPEAISAMLFDLSDRDATTFVRNVGYGHAAGYLMTHKIPIPQDLKTTTTAVGNARDKQINPITGQRLDAEIPVNMPEMTDAEKEREAERLFVLFERLNATGVMSVENPLRMAQQSGRFEELSDSDPD